MDLTRGLWTLSSVDRSDGGFSHCAISAPYTDGVNLIIWLDADGGWRFGMTHRDWQLDVDLPLPLALEMDGAPPVAIVAAARTPSMVLSEPLSGSPLIDRLRWASNVVVFGGAARFNFEFRDLREAFAVLEGCAEERGRQPVRADPVRESQRLFDSLAAHEGLDRVQRLPGKPHAALPNWDVVWRAGPLCGGLQVALPPRAMSNADVAAVIASDEARGCSGRFLSGTQPYEGTSGGVRFHAICSLPHRDEPLSDLLRFDDLLAAAFKGLAP